MTDEVVEKPISDFPGWTKRQIGTSRRYISPGGLDISAARFMQLSTKYRGQSYIPESEVLPKTPVTNKGFLSSKPNQSTKSKTENLVDQKIDQDIPDYGDIVTEIKPSQSKTKSKSRHPRPTAAALAVGIKKMLLIITAGIVAKMLNDGRAAMTEQEATVLATALGNLLEPTKLNDEFGWIVAETGDWQAVGYILIVYLSRVSDVVKEKRHVSRPNAGPTNATVPEPTASPGPNGAGVNGHNLRPGANLPYAPQGPRWFTQTPLNGQ